MQQALRLRIVVLTEAVDDTDMAAPELVANPSSPAAGHWWSLPFAPSFDLRPSSFQRYSSARGG